MGNGNGSGCTDEAIQTAKNSTLDGFKWRLVIAYDGTRYAGKVPLLLLIAAHFSHFSSYSFSFFFMEFFKALSLSCS